MKLNEYLVFLREGRVISREVLAKRLGYKEKTIRFAEAGKMITPNLLSAYNTYFRGELADDLELVCERCGLKFTSYRGLALYCKECAPQVKTCGRGVAHPKEHKYNPNPITKDTVMIICMFHLEGQSVKQIARLLKRPPDVVEKLLRRAILDGRYRMYETMKKTAAEFFASAKPTFVYQKACKNMSIEEDNK
ncbi:MAG: sigma-70 family RNA polymerase sigma factor [Clostridia bacterium]|nr:sigma-70 family RNA polymerase sigma factor [Clostridia bacterium]